MRNILILLSIILSLDIVSAQVELYNFLMILASSLYFQLRRRVYRKYGGGGGGGFYKKIKKVKVHPPSAEGVTEHDYNNDDLKSEAASERLLNPFSLFNLVRFPNTECTTDRGTL